MKKCVVILVKIRNANQNNCEDHFNIIFFTGLILNVIFLLIRKLKQIVYAHSNCQGF